MNSHDATGSLHARWRAYVWGTLAVVSCPCHLPLLALLLSGTVAGAFLAEHFLMAFGLLSLLFLVFLRAVLHALRNDKTAESLRRNEK
ncbi:mercury resistance protein [Nitrosomonas sp. JL21]|uniref:broad-spectrum mercury transporter MerE n=1 Tax=Nitrosomonas sp. JL21 TaxID=153949 RepID=UPI00137050B5|nr:broad-spectrum mercury transporter MerE [Nitrosomonas sp. JL21]MXS77393.1 mercury resistance protein [Nitrosomonas sp. JL21]